MVKTVTSEASFSGGIHRWRRLTQRQIEILQLIAEGKANKEVAVILSLAVKTVEFHKTRIMQILGLKTTSELTKYAISHGIISL